MPDERRVLRAGAVAVALLGLVAGGVPLLVGPPGGDDAYFHAMYAQQHAWCWRHGVLHPRWYPGINGGLGGAEPRTRPLAALAVQAALALALDDAVAASSLLTLLLPPAAGLLMLLAARRRGAGAAAALTAAAAWAAAPYLLVSLHQRAALQEVAALALLPVALAWLLPAERRDRLGLLPGALALAGLLATQLLVAFMAGVVVAAAWLVVRPRRLVEPAAAAAAALAVSAWSWLPNLASLSRIQGDVFSSGWFDWRQRFLLLANDPDPLLARHLTLALAGIAAAAVLLALAERGTPRWLALGALAAALLATPASRWVWEVTPGFAMLQFPWRWLGPAACLAALAIAASRRPWAQAAAAALLLAPALGIPWLEWRLPVGDPLRPSDPGAVVAAAATRYGVPPLLPPFPATLPPGVVLEAVVRRGAAARAALSEPLEAGPRRWRWRVDVAPARTVVVLPLLVDPAWRAAIDGAPVAWQPAEGLVAVEVARGAHEVVLRQALLWEEPAGAAISLLGAAAVLVWARRRGGRPGVSGTASRRERSTSSPR